MSYVECIRVSVKAVLLVFDVLHCFKCDKPSPQYMVQVYILAIAVYVLGWHPCFDFS